MTSLFLTHGSYLGIILILILTGAGLPIPEEVPILAAGLLSAHGQLDPWLAFLACLFGALCGDCVMYWLGRHFGRRVLREHHWWNRFVKPEREAHIERMLQDHGVKVFFLARFLVGLRSPVYVAAGILRVPFRRFLLIDLFCATSVIGVFFGLSYRYGETITHLIRNFEYALTGIFVLALIGVAFFLWRRHVRTLEKRLRETSGISSSEISGPVLAESTRPGSVDSRNDKHISSVIAPTDWNMNTDDDVGSSPPPHIQDSTVERTVMRRAE